MPSKYSRKSPYDGRWNRDDYTHKSPSLRQISQWKLTFCQEYRRMDRTAKHLIAIAYASADIIREGKRPTYEEYSRILSRIDTHISDAIGDITGDDIERRHAAVALGDSFDRVKKWHRRLGVRYMWCELEARDPAIARIYSPENLLREIIWLDSKDD